MNSSDLSDDIEVAIDDRHEQQQWQHQQQQPQHSSAVHSPNNDEQNIRRVFSQLRPLCTLISTFTQQMSRTVERSEVESMRQTIHQLSAFIDQCSHDQMDRIAICQCFSYISFPLFLLCEKNYLLYRNDRRTTRLSSNSVVQESMHDMSGNGSGSGRGSNSGDSGAFGGVPLIIMEQVIECFRVLFQCMDEIPMALNSNDQLMKFFALLQSMFIMYTESYDRSGDHSEKKDNTNTVSNNGGDKSDHSELNLSPASLSSTEEIKFALVSCLRSLIELHVYKKKNTILSNVQLQPLTALFLSKIIDILMNEKSHRLREECLRTISIILKSIDHHDILSSVFPGISSSLFKLLYTLPGVTMSKDGVNPSSKPINQLRLSQGVICEAFKTFRTSLELVCSNERNQLAIESEQALLHQSTMTREITSTDYSNILQNLRSISQSEASDDTGSTKNDRTTNLHQSSSNTQQAVQKLQTMRKHVDSFLQRIFSPENYAHLKSTPSRIELIRTCRLVLEQCDRTLWVSIPRTLECVMMGANDDVAPKNSYAELANESLTKYQRSVQFSDERVQNLLIERFSSLVHSLPNTCTLSINEEEKRSVFILVASYIKLVLPHNNLRSILEASDSMIEKISYALFIIFELDFMTNSKIVEESKSSPGSAPSIYEYPKKNMRHYREESTLKAAIAICFNIGRFSTVETFSLFVQHLRQLINQYSNANNNAATTRHLTMKSFHKESILILQYILLGFSDKIQSELNAELVVRERDALMKAINELFMDYFDEQLWSATIVNRSRSSNSSVDSNQDRASLACLLLESIGTLFEILGRVHPDEHMWIQSTRNTYLLRSLFPILEQLGESLQHVVHSALLTLDRIAQTGSITTRDMDQSPSCQIKRITDLIVLNCDYIIDEIRQRMKYLNLYPSTPRLLGTLFEYAALRESYLSDEDEMNDTSIVTVMQDTIDSVFYALDDYHLSTTYSHRYMPVFFSILSSILHVVVARKQRYDRMRAKHEEHEEDTVPQHECENNNNEDNELNGDGDKDDDDDTNHSNVDDDDDESGNAHPDYIIRERALVQQILGRCKNFVTIDDMAIQIHIIDILRNSLNVFMTERNSLDDKALPLVHSIWPTILARVMTPQSERIPVQQKVLELMEHLVVHCDEFMYGKIIEDMWPRILSHPMLETNRSTLPGFWHNRTCVNYMHALEQHRQRAKVQKDLRTVDPYLYLRTTPEYKLHVSLLRFLSSVTRDSSSVFMRRMSTVDAKRCLHGYVICEMLLPLLDHRLPSELQQLALGIIDRVSEADYASVWYSMMEYRSQRSQQPEAVRLTPVLNGCATLIWNPCRQMMTSDSNSSSVSQQHQQNTAVMIEEQILRRFTQYNI